MPHGKPDWGVDWSPRTIWGLEDLGEHAVRLGSPHLWDRQGDVIFLTEFTEGLGSVRGFLGGGAGGAICLHAGYNRQGAYCVKLTTDDDDLDAAILKHLPYPIFSRIGIEITFGFGTYTDYVQVWGDLLDATGNWLPEVRWDPNVGTLQCRTGLAAWYTMGTQQAYVSDCCSNSLKMVFDASQGMYVRVVANDVPYVLTNQPIYRDLLTVGITHFVARVGHHADPGRNAVAYMDSFIVTQNEP